VSHDEANSIGSYAGEIDIAVLRETVKTGNEIYYYFILSRSRFYLRTKFMLAQILIVSVVLNRTS
jgi:hypothetical protein